MDNSLLVSVIIPFYNCKYIDQAIGSVLNQTYKNIEIILINDGSTEYLELLEPYLKDVIYYEQFNQGVASALNQGLRLANGDYVAWLSSDDLFDDHKVELQLNYMLEKKADICFTNFNHINETNQITKYNVGIDFKHDLEVLHSLRNICPINGCTIMMSKEIIKGIGYFDETLKYAQDYDYWIRTALQFPIYFLNTTLTNYRVHPNMGSIVHNKQQMEEFHRIKNKYRAALDYVMVKRGNTGELIKFI